ncbi:MAG: putative photosynthetic complex assembly protein PuhE [Pseudomonadota bacterium]
MLLPIATALVAWWASTGALLWLIGRAPNTFRWSALGLTVLAAIATSMVAVLRDLNGPNGAYLGFATGLALWAWHEGLFLLGYVSGPRRTRCPEGLPTWRRFLVSAETVIHHEIAIACHAMIILMLSWQASNQVAAWTFLLLWGMRLNAKLVVFLGAPNLSEDFLPRHLTYLSSYFGQRRVTMFFPLFITLATSAATLVTYGAMTADTGSGLATGLWLLSGLAWLAVFEHWAMVLPIQDSALWRWALPSPPPLSPDTTQDTTRRAT